jgi:2'-5' RNA ligase
MPRGWRVRFSARESLPSWKRVSDSRWCVAPLREATGAVKWAAAQSLHVTLKFIGEQDESAVDAIRRATTDGVSKHEPFAVETTEVGAFPNFRRPRVVWVGMTAESSFRALASDVDAALAALGIARELRPFQAHLTLGRVRGELRPPEAKALARAAAALQPPRRAFTVRTVDLMQSELGPGGSRYSMLAAVPLHARGT